jgi:hypothetical protein
MGARETGAKHTVQHSAPQIQSVTAVVLTHMRPSLAGDVTRMLLEKEGLAPDRVIVVVNGEGGLDDPELESSVRMLRLPRNLGPAGGFRSGIAEAFKDRGTDWAYLCEDDISLLPLPSPRLAGLMDRVRAREADGHAVGAVVAFGRDFVGRGAHTVNVVPAEGTRHDLALTHVGSWGATVLSRAVVDAGVDPDVNWYFGLEDFDYYCRIREAGFEVLVDAQGARAVAAQQSSQGRDEVLRDRRPTDVGEAWRAYYHARNAFAIARRHGTPSWHMWHMAYSLRRLQRSRGRAERSAILHGLWDGARGRLGEHPRYVRRVGEVPASDGSPRVQGSERYAAR